MNKGFGVIAVKKKKKDNFFLKSLFTEAAEAELGSVNECFPAVQEKQ